MTTIPSSAATPAGALHTAFEGHRLLARGPLADIALTVRQTSAAGSDAAILVFDDQTGKQVDLDLRGDDAQIRQRYQPQPIASAAPVEDAAEAADAAPVSYTHLTLPTILLV